MNPAPSLDLERLPAHIGIIMDGNGRWAHRRHLSRTFGHREGLKAAKRIVKVASDIGIKYLTLYTFSTENWKRTVEEVGFLMGLIKEHIIAELDFYRENQIRLGFTGDLDGLPTEISSVIQSALANTASYTGLCVVLAINYGGRDELVRAFRKIQAADVLAQDISEQIIRANLDNPEIPDPDLIIRTAGELRTSNFLIWESAYSEYYFSDSLWPDFNEHELNKAILNFQQRKRRFGGVFQ